MPTYLPTYILVHTSTIYVVKQHGIFVTYYIYLLIFLSFLQGCLCSVNGRFLLCAGPAKARKQLMYNLLVLLAYPPNCNITSYLNYELYDFPANVLLIAYPVLIKIREGNQNNCNMITPSTNAISLACKCTVFPNIGPSL